MQTKFIEKQISYDGSQLSPLFAFKNFKLQGESLVAFAGPCSVLPENMKDGEDLFAGDSIAADQMLHFILELFEQPMMTMVSLQRLMTCIAKETLEPMTNQTITRDGDDLFIGDAKLSISIATRGAVSSMIHFAVNIKASGAPVKISCLEELEVDPKLFVESFMASFLSEYRGVVRATKKVFPL